MHPVASPVPPVAICRPSTRTVRLDLAYNGTNFRGFSENRGVRTVAGELRVALENVLGTPTASGTLKLSVAGRTDAGVHATAQVVSFTTDSDRLHTDCLADTLNRMLAPEIAVTSAIEVSADFDARHSARSRTYTYVVLNAAVHDPLRSQSQWHLRDPLDLAAMNAAAAHFVGEHDFSSFCRSPEPTANLRRRVLRAHWSEAPAFASTARLLVFEVTASAFCHQMVRSIVGLCVAVGQGRRHADDVPTILAAKNRNASANIAPPAGLTLTGIDFNASH